MPPRQFETADELATFIRYETNTTIIRTPEGTSTAFGLVPRNIQQYYNTARAAAMAETMTNPTTGQPANPIDYTLRDTPNPDFQRLVVAVQKAANEERFR